jgi:hypothetical protein
MDWSSSWEFDSRPACQEYSRHLWNPKVHYHVHKSPPPDQFWTLLLKIHLILYNTSSKWSITYRLFRLKFFMHFWYLSCVPHAPSLSSRWPKVLPLKPGGCNKQDAQNNKACGDVEGIVYDYTSYCLDRVTPRAQQRALAVYLYVMGPD